MTLETENTHLSAKSDDCDMRYSVFMQQQLMDDVSQWTGLTERRWRGIMGQASNHYRGLN